MHKKFFLLLILHPCLLFATPTLVSQNENEDEVDTLNVYDPFTDYIDFQDTKIEEEDMSFFQTGRVLSVGFYTGYRHFIFGPNQERNTTDSATAGAFIKNFVNLHIAIQFAYVISANKFFYTQNGKLEDFITIYHNFGAEFRYYWNRSQLVRTLARLNPYIAGGFLINRRTYQRREGNNRISASSNSGGLKGGLGLEYHLSTRFHLGLHAEYNFIFVKPEDECINTTNPKVCPPENMLNAMLVLGFNF